MRVPSSAVRRLAGRSSRGAGLAAVALALLPVPGAAAATELRCGDQRLGATRCSRVTVPLDRSGRVAGQIGLSVRTIQLGQRTRRIRREAVLLLAGGPGQAATLLAADVAPELAPLLRRRDLVAVDTRGTGRSTDLVVCPELETPARTGLDPVEPMRSCARRLGGAVDAYGTADVVADLEEVRRQGGYDRLLLVGISYGTYVAQRYAAAHPDRVSGMVLDSPVDARSDDPFSLAGYRAIPGALRQACARRACAGVTSDPRGDLRRTRERLPGTVGVDRGDGRRSPATVEPWAVTTLAMLGDVDPVLRAALPAVLRRAGEGDLAPLARLARESGLLRPVSDDADPTIWAASAAASSTGVYYATLCRDGRWPWDATTPVGTARRAAALAALTARSDAERAGWSPQALLDASDAGWCAEWPGVPAHDAIGPAPAVPTLILSGRDDTRTPPEEARAVARRHPGAQLLSVPAQGHSVLASGRGCVAGAIRSFAAGRPIGRCHRPAAVVRAAPLPPRSAAALGRDGRARARAVARATIEDAARSAVSRAFSVFADDGASGDRDEVHVAGLRSGHGVMDEDGLTLRRLGYVPGTAVTTVAPIGEQRRIRVRVRGAGLRAGTYEIANPIRTAEQLLATAGLKLEDLLPEDGEIELARRARRALAALGR